MAARAAEMRGETCKSISPSRGRTLEASGKVMVRCEKIVTLPARVNRSPAEDPLHFVHVREIIKKKVGLVRRQLLAGPRAGGDRDRPRAERFSAGYVVSGIADDVDLRSDEFYSCSFQRAGKGERP